jgi:O-antigen/teichoic acid export membrane protein
MKKTVIYTLVGLLSPALALLLLPIYLKYLTTNEYVILALTNSFLAVSTIFLNLKVDQAYRTLYFYHSENEAKQLMLFRTIFSFQLVSFLIWIVLFYFLGNTVFNLIYKNEIVFFPYAFILFVSFLIGTLSNFYFIHLQNKLDVKIYSWYIILSILLTHGLQLSCIFIFKLGFEWFLLAALFSNLFVFLLIYFNNRSLFAIEFSKSNIKEALKFSLPFIPFLILYNIENQMDRFFIEKFLSLEELARYAVLLSIATAIITLLNSFDNAIRPELYSILSTNKSKKKQEIQKNMDFYLLVGIVSLSFLLAFGTNIHWFLNQEKYNGIRIYFPWIVLAFLPLLTFRFLALVLVYENKINKINYFSIVKIALMCGLFWLLIPMFKIYGALVTIGISNVLNVVIFYKILQNKVLPSLYVNLCSLLLILISIFILIAENSKYVSLVSVIQFILFIFLFSKKYWNEITNQIRQIKLNA